MAKMIKKIAILGDAMIPNPLFEAAYNKILKSYCKEAVYGEYESVWANLQDRRLKVEQNGPEIEEVDPILASGGKANDSEMVLGLFQPMSKKMMDQMPNLKIIGVCRAGVENVNVEAATKKGVLVFNVQGRNAEAVSDFTIGLILSEIRNIARAHFSIKNKEWRKVFSNSDNVMELKGKTIGLIGFGYIGQLVAKKLSGFDVNVIAYDPYIKEEVAKKLGVKLVEKEELFKTSDIVSVHARLLPSTKGIIDKKSIDSMKKTAIFINTARSGLVDYDALALALKEKRILGAALDVFESEPLEENNPLIELDNVTLTTHIAGTTSEVLANSPGLLMNDIKNILEGGNSNFIVNPEVLDNAEFKAWLKN